MMEIDWEAERQFYAQTSTLGALFLDQTKPGWASNVNPDILELGSCTRCVVGQLTGIELDREWTSALRGIGIDSEGDEDVVHGFDVEPVRVRNVVMDFPYIERDDVFEYMKTESYSILTEEWRNRIKERME